MSFNPNDIDVDELEPLSARPSAAPTPADPADQADPSTTSGAATPDIPSTTVAVRPVTAAAVPALDAPASAVPAQADESTSEDTARTAEIAKYAKRRRRYQMIGLAAAAVAVWHIAPWDILSSGTQSGSGGTHTTVQAGKPSVDAVNADMAKVHAQLSKAGDLTDFTLPGARTAAAGKTLYASRTVQNTCIVYGVVNGKDIVPTSDPSGQACTAAQIAAVQTQLDQEDKAVRQDAVSAATTALTRAANSAVFFAQQNFVHGQPSFTGMTAAALDGASIVQNAGAWVKLSAKSGTTCESAVVSAAGKLGEVSSC